MSGQDYKGSENLKTPGPDGLDLSEAEKRKKDKEQAEGVAKDILGLVNNGVIKLPGSEEEYPVSPEQQQKLQDSLKVFIEQGVTKFDKDSEAGLDAREWDILKNSINTEAEKWLVEAKKAAVEELKQRIGKISLGDLQSNKAVIGNIIKAHAEYVRNSGAWAEINELMAKDLGIFPSDAKSLFTEEISLQLGGKIQSLVRAGVKGHNCGERGKIGPKTLNGLAKLLEIEGVEAGFVDQKPEESAANIAPVPTAPPVETASTAPVGEAHVEAPPATPPAETAAEQRLPIGPAANVELPRERALGPARLFEQSEAEQAIDQYSQKEQLQIIEAMAEGLTDNQKHRLSQVVIIKTVLESIRSDVKEGRTWGEWFSQVGEDKDVTGRRAAQVESAIRLLNDVAETIKADPNVTIEDLVAGTDVKYFMQLYKLQDKQEKRGEHTIIIQGQMMDINGRIKDAQSLPELQKQYCALIQFLRDRKDYSTAQMLVEDKLLGPYFAEARALLLERQKQLAAEVEGKSRAKIYKMFNAEAYASLSKQGWTSSDIDEHIKQLVEEDKNRSLNKIIAEWNDGVPFPQLQGAEKNILMGYRDMMGAGDLVSNKSDFYINVSDETWNMILEEVIINAPLILASGGIASVARGALSAGARALIASGRLSKILSMAAKGVAAAEKGKALVDATRLEKYLYWSGRAAGLGVEGAAFELAHTGLQGEWLFNSPDWAQRIVISSITLGAFKMSSQVAKKAAGFLEKNIKSITNPAVRTGISQLLARGSIEPATMLAISAAQHGYYNGNLEDFEWSKEILHAFVTAGALQVAHHGAGTVLKFGSKIFEPKEKPRLPETALVKKEAGREDIGQAKKIERETSKKKDASEEELKYKKVEDVAKDGKERLTEKDIKELKQEEIDGLYRKLSAKNPDIEVAKKILGIEGEFTLESMKMARNKLLHKFHADKYKDITNPELQRKLGHLTDLANKAFNVLKPEAKLRAEKERKAEEARRAEEARKAEEVRKAEEARRAEEARKAAEKKFETASGETFAVGEEVYIKRSNGVVEKGWYISGERDGNLMVKQQGTDLIRPIYENEIWKIEKIEQPNKGSLGDAAAEFERRKFQVLKKNPTLSKSDFYDLFQDWQKLKQQNVGNCYLIAALNSMRASPHFEALMRTSIKILKGGHEWEVKVPLGDANGRTIRITEADLVPQRNPDYRKRDKNGEVDDRHYLDPVNASLGFQILEAAYSKSMTGRDVVDRTFLDRGGFGHRALLYLFGDNFIKVRVDGESGSVNRRINPLDTQVVYSESPVFDRGSAQAQQAAFDFLNNFHPSKNIATANTPPARKGDSARFRIEGVDYEFANQHAYSIVRTEKPSLSGGKGKVFLANPWDTGQVIELTYDQFSRVFSQISAVEIDYSKMFVSGSQRQRAAGGHP